MNESTLYASYINFDKLKLFSSSLFFEIYEVLLILISAVFVILLFILYKNIRRKFPVKVNCWFCNCFTSVPYECFNSWDCPNCKQYNGFTKDGDYNKVIKEQFNSKLNENVSNIINPLNSLKGSHGLRSNGFCKLCNINQQLKIQQLALFVPLNESKYFEEIEQFREKLEKAYKLCSKCEKTLQETLEKQEYNLLQNRLNGHQQNISPKKSEVLKLFNANKSFPVDLKTFVFSGLRWTTLIIAVIMFLALFYKFEAENKFIYLMLPDTIILDFVQPYLKLLATFISNISDYGRELSFAGFFSSLMILSECFAKTDRINLLVWGILHILLWSNLTGFQVLMAGVSVFFNSRTVKSKKIYFTKKTFSKKYTFQPEKKVFHEVFNPCNDELTSKITPPLKPNEALVSKETMSDINDMKSSEQCKSKIENTSPLDEKKKKKKKENEVELPANESPIKTKLPLPTNSTSNPTNSSVFNKSFLSALNVDKNEEENAPLKEVYSNFNDLHLGGKQKKTKSPNFLFANHSFSEKKNSCSIIKPAKFIKNVSNSWTGTESNESVSRSSTPSSGYSSQKAEKIDTTNRYEFTKSISPISINPLSRPSPPNCFEYWDGNNSYYNNFNCFSPGFIPFQHFPGPIGHTTIFTCSRPPNFSFPFPCQSFSPQKFSPSSPRFSDTSDCENLFQNASKSFESTKKWLKLKTIFYWFSVCLNFITLLCLLYFFSAGIISVDWNLPKFNFFV